MASLLYGTILEYPSTPHSGSGTAAEVVEAAAVVVVGSTVEVSKVVVVSLVVVASRVDVSIVVGAP